MKSFRKGSYVIIATNSGLRLGLVIEMLSEENKVKYFTDNKLYDTISIQKIKGQIKRNEFRFGCYLHQIHETNMSNIKEILGAAPKRRFQRIMTTKTFF